MKSDLFDDQYAKTENYNKNIMCKNCEGMIERKDFLDNLHVCPRCGYHYRLNARERISMVCDKDTFIELYPDLESANPLEFPEYDQKIKEAQNENNELEAFACGEGEIGNHKVALGVLDSFFIMGSMGCVVGEKVTLLTEYATTHKLPLIIFTASGGARMQEGIFSLMQMVKTSAAIKEHNDAGLLYISVLTDPTTGGVLASFAGLGDIIIAERGALIGFAGKRVIKETIQQELPEGFQSVEFQLEKGFIDLIVDRKDLKGTLVTLLNLHQREIYNGN